MLKQLTWRKLISKIKTMKKFKLVKVLILLGFLICNTLCGKSTRASKNQINNNSKNLITMNSTSKFEFKQLPYSYDALSLILINLRRNPYSANIISNISDNFINAIVVFCDILRISKYRIDLSRFYWDYKIVVICFMMFAIYGISTVSLSI